MVLPRLIGHLNNLVRFLEQLEQIESRTPVPSLDLPAENNNDAESVFNLFARFGDFPFAIEGDAGNKEN